MMDVVNPQFSSRVSVASRVIVAVLLILVLFSGVYVVQSDEVAIVLRFGELTGASPAQQIKTPGIHFSFTRVIDEVIKIPVGRVMQLKVSTHYVSSLAIDSDVANTGYLITGDQNIMLVEADVKFQIVDPIAFSLNHYDVINVINGVVSTYLREEASETNVDSIMTTGKAILAQSVVAGSQVRLDELGCGIYITNLDLTNVSPPSETMADFEAVIAAGIQKETLMQQAQEYRVNTIPSAQSEAQSLIDNAKVARNEAISVAQNDVSAFIGLYEQYQLDPSIVIEGVLRERIGAALAKMRVVLTDSEEESVRILLP